jgi:hypothetical protein
MKYSAIVALSLTASAQAAKFISGPSTWINGVGFNVSSVNEPLVRRHAKRAVAPKRQELKNRNPHIPGAKTIKIRYGPYTVPGGVV